MVLVSGCELAMLCDIIIAGDNVHFKLSEIPLDTQRLVRAIGKSQVLELLLTGKNISSVEAKKYGIVNIVAEKSKIVQIALDFAQNTSSFSKIKGFELKKKYNLKVI